MNNFVNIYIAHFTSSMRLKDVAEMSLSQLSGEDNLKDLLYPFTTISQAIVHLKLQKPPHIILNQSFPVLQIGLIYFS